MSVATHEASPRENTIYGKLKADLFSTILGKDVQKSPELAAYCSIELQNKSLFDLYYQIEEADLSLAEKTHSGSTVDNAIMIVQAASSNRITFPTIFRMKPEPMTGRMKLKLKYGKKREFLNRRFELIAEPQIAVGLDGNGNVTAILSTFLMKEVKYL